MGSLLWERPSERRPASAVTAHLYHRLVSKEYHCTPACQWLGGWRRRADSYHHYDSYGCGALDLGQLPRACSGACGGLHQIRDFPMSYSRPCCGRGRWGMGSLGGLPAKGGREGRRRQQSDYQQKCLAGLHYSADGWLDFRQADVANAWLLPLYSGIHPSPKPTFRCGKRLVRQADGRYNEFTRRLHPG